MKHVDKLFKERLYNHEVVVPEGMWEKIAPIAEEESGRALIWFWLAGILALAIGGYGIYKMATSAESTPQDPGTLVYDDTPQTPTIQLEDQLASLTTNLPENQDALNSSKSTGNSYAEMNEDMSSDNANSSLNNRVKSAQKIKTQKQKVKPQEPISNTVENIPNAVGIPANLVITKSYMSKEGSVIRQSNLTDNSGIEDPVYDVIINSEAKELNAGALLRIIEPLENIPLPGFQKTLKKKTLTPML